MKGGKELNKQVMEILKDFDNTVLDISEMQMKVRSGDAPFRDATETDKLDFLKEEWFRVVEKLNELGYDITTN